MSPIGRTGPMSGRRYRANVCRPWDRLKVMRAVITAVAICLAAAGCTPSRISPSSSDVNNSSLSGPWFKTAEQAIKHTCHAYWIGLVIQRTAGTERQWETKPEYNSGAGRVARLEHSTRGYRVADCLAARYDHG